jgi:hypothetical protein
VDVALAQHLGVFTPISGQCEYATTKVTLLPIPGRSGTMLHIEEHHHMRAGPTIATSSPCHVLPLLMVGGLLLSCDGKKSAPPGSAATVGDFCNSLCRAAVQLQTNCLGGTEAFWRQTYSSLFDCAEWTSRVSTGGFVYDAQKGAQCLDEISRYSCDDSGEVYTCTGAISGTVLSGETCKATMDGFFSSCTAGNHCELDASICGGTCKPYRQPGETCTSSCADGSSCQHNTDVCVRDVGEGQPCQGKTAGDCTDDLHCDGGSLSTEGVCRKKKTTGACSNAEECANRYRCVGSDGAKTCRKAKWVGEPCTPGLGECYPMFSWCGSDGKCTDAKAQEGQPCGVLNADYIACASGLVCSQNTCQKGLPAGSPCTSSSVCTGGTINFCDSKTKLCMSCE